MRTFKYLMSCCLWWGNMASAPDKIKGAWSEYGVHATWRFTNDTIWKIQVAHIWYRQDRNKYEVKNNAYKHLNTTSKTDNLKIQLMIHQHTYDAGTAINHGADKKEGDDGDPFFPANTLLVLLICTGVKEKVDAGTASKEYPAYFVQTTGGDLFLIAKQTSLCVLLEITRSTDLRTKDLHRQRIINGLAGLQLILFSAGRG